MNMKLASYKVIGLGNFFLKGGGGGSDVVGLNPNTGRNLNGLEMAFLFYFKSVKYYSHTIHPSANVIITGTNLILYST